ncbi:uncharacterized protein LOC144328439 [Podarcis muralis]
MGGPRFATQDALPLSRLRRGAQRLRPALPRQSFPDAPLLPLSGPGEPLPAPPRPDARPSCARPPLGKAQRQPPPGKVSPGREGVWGGRAGPAERAGVWRGSPPSSDTPPPRRARCSSPPPLPSPARGHTRLGEDGGPPLSRCHTPLQGTKN